MKKSVVSTLCLSTLYSLAEARGFVRYDLQRLPRAGRATADIGSIETTLTGKFAGKEGYAYYLNASVGTPGQQQTVLIDTGSSDFILSASNASACEASNGCAGGTFDPTNSSTFEMITPDGLHIRYAGFASKSGDHFTDVVQLGDDLVTGAHIGLAYNMSQSVGPYTPIMGLGYSSNRAMMSGGQSHYPTFVETLVNANLISSRLYSIHLNQLYQPGSITFGGIDVGKFKGPLTTLNCKPVNGTVKDFWLNLDEITAQSYDGHKQSLIRSTGQKAHLVLPDSGSNDWSVPTETYNKIIELMGGGLGFEVNATARYLERPCGDVARGTANGTYFQLTFSGDGPNTATLKLEMADLFVPKTTEDGRIETDNAGQQICQLLVYDAGEPEPNEELLLGASVMKAGYWVFDLDNGQISIAQANFEASSSKVVSVAAGADGLSYVVTDLRPEAQTNHVEGRVIDGLSATTDTVDETVDCTTD